MIKVVVKKIRERKKNDITESLTVDTLNSGAQLFADKIKKHVKVMRCLDCVITRLTITISSDRRETITVKKSGACCKKLSDSIDITMK